MVDLDYYHNDHCIVTLGGENWRIAGMTGLSNITLEHLDFPELCAQADLSGVDFDSYIRSVYEMLRERWGVALLLPD